MNEKTQNSSENYTQKINFRFKWRRANMHEIDTWITSWWMFTSELYHLSKLGWQTPQIEEPFSSLPPH